jgi:hypothetical protein
MVLIVHRIDSARRRPMLSQRVESSKRIVGRIKWSPGGLAPQVDSSRDPSCALLAPTIHQSLAVDRLVHYYLGRI